MSDKNMNMDEDFVEKLEEGELSSVAGGGYYPDGTLFYKCKICGSVIWGEGNVKMTNHLYRKHESELTAVNFNYEKLYDVFDHPVS